MVGAKRPSCYVKHNKRVRPLRGRPLWGRPCSWVRTDGGNGRCHGNEGTWGKAARDPYATCQISSWSDNRQWSYGDFFANNAISRPDLDLWPLDLVIGPGVLVSQGPFLLFFVYVGLFVFPLGGGTLAFGYGRPTQATAGNLEIGPRGARVPGTLPTKFGLPRYFRFFSTWRHGTDRQTDSIDT